MAATSVVYTDENTNATDLNDLMSKSANALLSVPTHTLVCLKASHIDLMDRLTGHFPPAVRQTWNCRECTRWLSLHGHYAIETLDGKVVPLFWNPTAYDHSVWKKSAERITEALSACTVSPESTLMPSMSGQCVGTKAMLGGFTHLCYTFPVDPESIMANMGKGATRIPGSDFAHYAAILERALARYSLPTFEKACDYLAQGKLIHAERHAHVAAWAYNIKKKYGEIKEAGDRTRYIWTELKGATKGMVETCNKGLFSCLLDEVEANSDFRRISSVWSTRGGENYMRSTAAPTEDARAAADALVSSLGYAASDFKRQMLVLDPMDPELYLNAHVFRWLAKDMPSYHAWALHEEREMKKSPLIPGGPTPTEDKKEAKAEGKEEKKNAVGEQLVRDARWDKCVAFLATLNGSSSPSSLSSSSSSASSSSASAPVLSIFGSVAVKPTASVTDPTPISTTYTKISLAKFLRDVVPKADRIQYMCKSNANIYAFVKGDTRHAKPLIRWHEKSKNTVSWYCYTHSKNPDESPAKWGLVANSWVDVKAVLPFPHMWNPERAFPSFGQAFLFVLKGAHDSRLGGMGNCIFPSMLLEELHPARQVIDHYNSTTRVDFHPTTHQECAGVCLEHGTDGNLAFAPHQFKVVYRNAAHLFQLEIVE